MGIKSYQFKSIVSILILFFLSNITTLFAQKASAEFISELQPAAIKSGQMVGDGVRNVTYHNQILYVVNIWAGIQVVDVSNVYKPKQIGTYQNDHRAHNMFIEGNYGYVSDELAGVTILDISNPRSPKKAGHIETKGDAFWVEAQFPYIYVAEAEDGVRVYDITDMANPTEIGSYDTPGWAWGLKLNGNYVYVADKTSGLQIIDFTDKRNPVRVGQFTEPKQAKSIFLENNILYLTNGPDGLYIIDVENPKFPALVSKLKINGFVFDLFKMGKYAYIANESTKQVEIVNITDVKKPVLEASYQADDKVFGVWKEDVYVFVAANNKTLILRHNSPPVLEPIASQIVDEMALLTVTPKGYDPDGDATVFSISNKPEGARFDSSSGVFTWTPNYEQSGIYNVAIRITEKTASKLWVADTFDITVNHVNRPPSLPEVPNYTVNENKILTFEIPKGSDEDKEDFGKLVYSAENLPEGAKLDPATRKFTWTPTFEQSGTYVVDFIIKDPPGALDREASTLTVIHVDRKPVMEIIADQNVNENELLEFTVTGSDPDKEDQKAISFAATKLPEGSGFNAANQKFSWTPTYVQSGNYSDLLFRMTAGNLSDSIVVKVTVNHVNRPPVLDAISDKMIDESKRLKFSISGSDPDVEDTGKLKYTAGNLPTGAKFYPDSLIFSWIPTFEQAGRFENVVFIVTDPAGLSDEKSTQILVTHINRAPVLSDIPPFTTDENNPFTFNVSGSDPDQEDQNKLVYSVKDLPAGASFENQKFNWTPTYDQSGEYTLQFTLSDGKLSDTKSTTVTVNHINRPPTLQVIEAKSTNENKMLEFKAVGNDPDREDTGKWILSAEQLPAGATFNAELAAFQWIPTFEQSGSYTIKIKNTDPQGLLVSQDVPVTVNHVNRTSVFNPIAAQVVDENINLNFIIPPGEDPDVEDKDKITYAAQNLPEGANFNPVTRVISWTPTYEQSGQYETQITCSDGEFNVVQPLSITVNHINRAPTVADLPDQTIDEEKQLEFSITAGDPDKEDAGKFILSATELPEGAIFDPVAATFKWKPTFVQSGTYTVTFTNTDPFNLSASKQAKIVVNHVNRAPVFNVLTPQVVDENMLLSFVIPPGDDPDSEDAQKIKYSAKDLPDGAAFDPVSRNFSWTPNYEQSGEYQSFITCSDDEFNIEQAFKITVNHINRPPVINAIENKVIDENQLLSFTPDFNDPDKEDNGKLKFTSQGLPQDAQVDASSGQFTWTPSFVQSGTYDNVVIEVADPGGLKAGQTFSITVNHINRPPTMNSVNAMTVAENTPLSFQFTAADEDEEDTGKLSFSSANLPQGASLDPASGVLTWTPTFLQAGSYTSNITVTDGGGLTASQSVSIEATDVNRTPVINPVEGKTIKENEKISFSLTAVDEDMDNSLRFSIDGLPNGSSLDAESGSFSWTPDFDQAGNYSLTAKVSDGREEVSANFAITVNNVNRPPTVQSGGSTTVAVGETADLSFEANDADNDKLTFGSTDLPDGAALNSGNGEFTWTPTENQVGTFSFTVTVTDGSESAETSASVTVNPKPQAPNNPQ